MRVYQIIDGFEFRLASQSFGRSQGKLTNLSLSTSERVLIKLVEGELSAPVSLNQVDRGLDFGTANSRYQWCFSGSR